MRISIGKSLCALSALALGACGQSASDDKTGGGSGKTALENAAEVAFQMQPGKYRTTMAIQKIEVPGMPPQMAERMKAMMSKAASAESCVTPEAAKRGLDVMKEQMAKGKCQFEKFEASGGTLDTAFTCQSGQGLTMKATSHGTFSPTGSQVQVVRDMAGPGGKTMHVEQTVTTERVGECS